MAEFEFRIPSKQQQRDTQLGAERAAVEAAQEVVPAEDTAPDPESFGEAANRQIGNVGKFAFDEFTLSALRPVEAAVTAGVRTLKGEDRNSFSDASEDVHNKYDTAAQELGLFGIPVSVATGLVQGPVKAIDTMLDPALTLAQKVAHEVIPFKQIAGRAAAAGGSTAAFQSYMQGNTDFTTLVQDGTVGTAFAGTMQKMLGNNVLPYMASMKADPASLQLINEMSDTGASSKGINLHTLAELADRKRVAGGDGATTMLPLLQEQVGDAPTYRTWDKVADVLENHAYKGVPVGKIGTPEQVAADEEYTNLVRAVFDDVTAIHKAADDNYEFLVEPPATRMEALKSSSDQRAAAGETYSRITEMRPTPDNPNPLGARTLPSQGILTQLQDSVMGNRDSMENTSPATKKMYNFAKNQIREVMTESEAAAVKNVPADRTTSRDELFGDVALARLVDAYKTIGAELQPMAAAGNKFNSEDIAAGRKILNTFAEIIDEQANGAFGMAKGTFADAMQQEEAYDMGKLAYTKRSEEVGGRVPMWMSKEYGDSITGMLDGLKEGKPEVYEAYQLGQRAGFDSGVRRHGFVTEMHNLLGEGADIGAEGSFYSGKKGGRETLERVFGDDAPELVRMLSEGPPTDKANARLTEVLRSRGVSASDAKRVTEALPVTMYGDTKIFGKKLLSRWVKDKDKPVLDAAIELMAGGAGANNVIEQAVQKHSGGGPVQIGARAGNAAPAPNQILTGEDDDNERRTIKDGKGMSISEALNSLAEQ